MLVIQAAKSMGGDKKGSQGRNLLKCMRRSVARDFRINGKKVEEMWQQDECDHSLLLQRLCVLM